jgi:H+-transporting ATPase
LEVQEDEVIGPAKPWWAFWRSNKKGATRSLSDFVTPDDWLTTHIRVGLDPAEVERRRKYTGWNELTSEKENMFLKFIGFFRGPILYGMSSKRETPLLMRDTDIRCIVMEAAAILAFALKDFLDAAIILAILLLNAIVGW